MKKIILLLTLSTFSMVPALAQNSSDVQQSGTSNEANISQTLVPSSSLSRNIVEVTQNGADNTIPDLKQLGSGNRFTVTQDGTGNRLSEFTDQGGSDNTDVPSYDGVIEITQVGNNNFVDDADQVGTGNELYIHQGEDGSPANNNYVTVEAQVSIGGTGNYVRISQSGNNNYVGDSNTQRGVYQEGSENQMNITQSGGATAGKNDERTPPSEDFDNRFFKSQFGGEGLLQIGNDNQITINQSGPSSVDFIYQNGGNNSANVMQNGFDHAASVTQIGFDNVATITQN